MVNGFWGRAGMLWPVPLLSRSRGARSAGGQRMKGIRLFDFDFYELWILAFFGSARFAVHYWLLSERFERPPTKP